MNLDSKDRKILREIQDGIPIKENPFREIAEKTGIEIQDLFDRLRNMKGKGIIRRFGASVNHRRLGYGWNGVVVCEVADERVNEVGKKISKNQEVTHCYQRLPHPKKWEYNLYFVVHASTKGGCENIARTITREVGIGPESYEIIYSTRTFKRKGVKL